MIKPTNRQIILWLVIGVGLVAAALLILVTWINGALASTSILQKSQKSLLFDYELIQSPARPTAGHPVVFKIRITKDGQPLDGRKVKVGIGHSYGLFIDDRSEDLLEQELTTDSNGNISFTKVFNFKSFREDRGFSVSASPILSEEETTIRNEKLKSSASSAELNTASNFYIDAVYPYWLGWFLWR